MKIAFCILILCILNFVVFVTVSIKIGGSAANGYIENGRYFVSDHGKDTEVTEQIWNYSMWHNKSLMLTHPLAGILLVVVGSKWERRKRKILDKFDSNTF